VAEDLGDVGDIEFDVDDEVAGEGMAEVMDTQPRLSQDRAAGSMRDGGESERDV
jgi:hypothetical protein